MRLKWLLITVCFAVVSGCSLLSISPGPVTPTIEKQTSEPSPATTLEPAAPVDTAMPELVREPTANPVAVDRPLAARVNNEPIYLDSYEQQLTHLEQTLQAQGLDPASETGQARLAKLRQQVLAGLIDQLLIEQEAKRLGLTITDEMLEVRVQESIARRQGQSNFEDWLAANDLTRDRFKEALQAQMIATELFEQLNADLPETSEQILLQQIRVADISTAQAIIEQLKSGASFDSLAEGDPEWIARKTGQLAPEVEEFAFSLEAGQVGGPIQTGDGFYIIKLKQREFERPLTSEIRQALGRQIFTDWLRDKRSAAVIETFFAP